MKKSLSLKKICKVIACLSLVLFAGIIFAACGAPKTLWKADLTKADVFGMYGDVTLNENKTVTLTPVKSGDVYTAANTYFGENDDHNYDWHKGGMSVSFTTDVKAEDITANNAVVWSLALNEKVELTEAEEEALPEASHYRYLTELAVFFVGTEDGVKFVYAETGVDQTDYTALVAGDDATLLTDGEYTVTYDFNVDKDGYVKVVVSLKDANNKKVYSSEESTFAVIDSQLYENGTDVKEDMVEGLRYLWCVRVTANNPVTVSSVEITE